MNFTKQDIQKLHEGLAKYAKKDSDFKPLNTVDVGTDIAVLHDGTNKRVSFETLLLSIAQKIDLSKIPVAFSGHEETTLDSALLTILNAIKNGEIIGFESADDIPYGNTYIGNNVKVGPALDRILNILYGATPFPTAAADSDINGLFTTN